MAKERRTLLASADLGESEECVMPPMANVKGPAVIQLKEFLRDRHGDEGLKKILDQLTPEERILVTEKLLPISKVPAPIYDKIYQGVKTLFGGGKGDYYAVIHEYVGEKSLNSFMKMLLKLGSPSFVAHNAPVVWKHFFDTGRMLKVAGTSNSVDYVIEDAEAYGEWLCHSIIGFGRMAIRMSGGKNIRVNHDECIYKGKSRCFFHVEWD